MAQQHVASGTVFSLNPYGERVAETLTHAILKSEQLELVRIVLAQGKELRQHKAPGEITVLCIEGRIDLECRGSVHTLVAGDCIHLQKNEPHALRAVVDASALLTLCIA